MKHDTVCLPYGARVARSTVLFIAVALIDSLFLSYTSVYAEKDAFQAFTNAISEADLARQNGNENKEVASLEKAVGAYSPSGERAKDISLLHALERLYQKYPGGNPKVTPSIRRNAIRIRTKMLELDRVLFGPASQAVENDCFAIGWMSAVLRDHKKSVLHYKCFYEARAERMGSNSVETYVALSLYAEELFSAGEIDEAETAHKRAVQKIDSLNRDDVELARALARYSGMLHSLGMLEEYEQILQKSLSTYERLSLAGSSEYLFQLRGLINFLLQWERYEEADPLIWHAYLRIREEDPESFLTALFAWSAGGAAERAGQPLEAKDLYEQSLALHLKHVGPTYEHLGSLKVSLAGALLSAKLPDDAIRTLNDVFRFFKESGNSESHSAASAHSLRARIAYELGDLENARLHLELAGKIYDTVSQAYNAEKAWNLYRLSEIAERQNDSPKAVSSSWKALNTVRDRLVTSVDLLIDTSRARASLRPIVSRFIKSTMQFGQGKVADSFEASQLANIGDTAATIARMALRGTIGNPSLTALLRKIQDTRRRLQEIDSQTAAHLADDDDQSATLRVERAQLQRQLEEYNEVMEKQFVRHKTFTSSRPMSVQEVRQLLHDGEALVNFHFSDKHGYVWIIKKRGGIEFSHLDINDQQLREIISELRKELVIRNGRPPNFNVELAFQLYTKLLSPVERFLGDVDHLLIVPDGPLRSIPFGILVVSPPKFKSTYADQEWLINRFALSNLPAVTSLRALRPPTVPTESKWLRLFAGIGDPVLEGPTSNGDFQPVSKYFSRRLANVDKLRRLPRLQATRDELLEMGRIFGASQEDLFLDNRAKESLIRTKDLSIYRLIVFATHGIVNGDDGEVPQPGLVLTPPAIGSESDDGLLTASEIAQMKLNADWVILSACNTAASDGTPGGEAFSGLAKSFFYAGARTVLVSQWYIASKATAHLTTSLIQVLKESPQIGKSKALAEAMNKMIKEGRNSGWSHPAFWGPFSLVGDGWR